MEAISQTKPPASTKRRMWITITGILLVALAASWAWRSQSSATDTRTKKEKAVHVVTAVVKQGNISVRLTANGTVSPQQTVAVRPQLSAVIRSVHIKEG